MKSEIPEWLRNTADEIMRSAAALHDVSYTDLKGRRKTRSVVRARHQVIAALQESFWQSVTTKPRTFSATERPGDRPLSNVTVATLLGLTPSAVFYAKKGWRELNGGSQASDERTKEMTETTDDGERAKMTPNEFYQAAVAIAKQYEGDKEVMHAETDKLMEDVLTQLGYEKGIEFIGTLARWHA